MWGSAAETISVNVCRAGKLGVCTEHTFTNHQPIESDLSAKSGFFGNFMNSLCISHWTSFTTSKFGSFNKGITNSNEQVMSIIG